MDARTVSGKNVNVKTDATSAERFGYSTASSTDPHQHNGGSTIPLLWDIPNGWSELPPTQMRLINLSVAGNSDAECYLSILPGGGGGLLANINRWRKQMALTPLTPEEVTNFPSQDLFGRPATYIELDGNFTDMSGINAKSDYRLVGVILEHQDISIFVKMTGPISVVSSEIENFQEFCRSIRINTAESPASHGRTGRESSPPFTWTAPLSWKAMADKPMRLVSYTAGPHGKTECYITVLANTGGGIEANINRWQGQMGADALAPNDIDKLPDIEIMGGPAKLVEISGDFTDMQGEKQQSFKLLGVVCPRSEWTIFVKMTGPNTDVDGERDNFLKFCRSIQVN